MGLYDWFRNNDKLQSNNSTSKIDDLSIVFAHHLERLRNQELMNNPKNGSRKMGAVLDEIEKMWNENFSLIDAKVSTTLSDGQLHSIGLGGGGHEVILRTYVIPVPIKDARNYFARGTPASYTEIIGRMINSPDIQMAREMGGKILTHIVICADAAGSPLTIQMCILPFRNAGEGYTRVLPIELLSDYEREEWSK